MDNHGFLELKDEVAEAFSKSPYYPIANVGDSMYILDPNNDGETVAYWLSVKMEVVSYFNDETTNEKYLRIRAIPENFPEEEKDLPTTILEKRTFTEINRYGWVYEEKYLAELINYMKKSAANAAHLIRYNSIGWKEMTVKAKGKVKTKDVFRTNTVIGKSNSKCSKYSYEYTGVFNFQSKKLVENYVKSLNKLITTKGMQFAVVAGLSSVILARMNMINQIGSIIIHIYGDSSRGKTTFLKLACSCWGNPNKTPLVSSWNATSMAILTTLSDNFGVAIGLDEASSTSNDFSKTIYAIANDVDKKRSTKELTLRETKTWCTTVVSTAEESLLNHSNNNNGLKIRCLEFFNLEVTESAEHA